MSSTKLAKTPKKSQANLNRSNSSKNELSKDLIFKMSKKIAQLTKVIYYLNTKNEDTGQRMKYMADEYEHELKDTVRDGESVIQELQIKLSEVEARNAQYLATIRQKDELIQKQEGMLEEAKEAQARIEERAKQKVKAAKGMLKETTDSNLQLASDLASAEETKRLHMEELEELKGTHTNAMADLRDQHFQEIQNWTDKVKELKNTISALEAQLDKEASRRQVDMMTLKKQMEEREQVLKLQYETMSNQMQQNLQEEIRRIDQKNQQIVDLSDQIDNKNLLISGLEADKWELEQNLRKLQERYEEITNNHDLLNQEHKYVEELVKKLEKKIPVLEDELSSTKSMLDRYMQLYTEAAEKNTVMTSTIATLENDLKLTTQEYKDTIAALLKLKEEFEQLAKVKEQQDAQIIMLNTTIENNQIQYLNEMQEKLSEQKGEMVRAREQEVQNRITEIVAEKDNLLFIRLDEINRLKQQTEDLKAAHQLTIDDMNRATDALKKLHGENVDALNETIESKKKLLAKANETIDEKDKAIFAHMNTIQTREATIKVLEVDMADLFQKMVQCDKQIRSEMLEKFTKEKYDLEAEWIIKHNMDMESLKVSLERETRERNSRTTQELRNQFQEELDTVHSNYRLKIENLMQDLAEKESSILGLRKDIIQIEQKMRELTYQFEEKEEKLKQEFEETMLNAKTEWDQIMAQKEKEAQEQLQEALTNLETKHTNIQSETTISHKKQIDDLRNFYSVSMSNAKKEFETQKALELSVQKSNHESYLISLITKHETFVIAERNRIAAEKTLEITKLSAEYESTIKDLTLKLEKEIQDNTNLLQVRDDLRQRLDDLETKLEDKNANLTEQERIMKARMKDFEEKMQQLREEHANTLKSEKEQLQVLHIQELQAMVQEFERAKNYLKKEIAHLQKLLEEAAEKYINREPRVVDVQTIEQLTKENASQTKRIQELNNELQNYRLEMNNRDVAFNKIFNNVPLVGIMAPKQKTPVLSKKKTSNPRLPPLDSNT